MVPVLAEDDADAAGLVEGGAFVAAGAHGFVGGDEGGFGVGAVGDGLDEGGVWRAGADEVQGVEDF